MMTLTGQTHTEITYKTFFFKLYVSIKDNSLNKICIFATENITLTNI